MIGTTGFMDEENFQEVADRIELMFRGKRLAFMQTNDKYFPPDLEPGCTLESVSALRSLKRMAVQVTLVITLPNGRRQGLFIESSTDTNECAHTRFSFRDGALFTLPRTVPGYGPQRYIWIKLDEQAEEKKDNLLLAMGSRR